MSLLRSKDKTDHPKLMVVTSGMFGNVLEWYDFALYGFLAVVLSELFFAPGGGVVSLMGTYLIFASGFLMRPLGAWLFGYIGDVFGRRKALLLSVLLMGIATFLLGVLPTYATVGVWAPVFLVLLRLLQGLSVGGEFSTSVTYMVEQAPTKLRGFFGSFANIGSMGGMLLGAGAAALVTTVLSHDALTSWGWRIPYLFGGVLGVIAILIRRHMPTSVMHEKEKRHSQKTPLRQALEHNRSELAEAITMSMGYAVFFYLVLVYLPTYANEFLNMSLDVALQLNTAAIVFAIFLIPIAGYVSDTLVSRKYLIMGSFAASLCAVVPLFILMGTGTILQFAIVQFILTFLIAVPLGSAPALYVELFPKSDRLTAYSITFNVSLGIFGGTTPLICTWLAHTFNDQMMPAYYLMLTLTISLVGLYFMKDRRRVRLT